MTTAIVTKTLTLTDFLPIARLIHSASKDQTRYALNGVKIDGVKGRAIAADGHMMAEIELPELVGFPSVIIDADICKAALKVKPREQSFYNVEILDDKCVLTNGVDSVTRLHISASFPETDQVKPKDITDNIEVNLNPELLVQVLESFKAVKGQRGVKLTIPKTKGSPIVVTCQAGTYALVMPMRSL